MTRRVYVTDLKEVNSLRVVCKKCKAEMIIPVGEQTPPEKCFSCKTDLPWHEINDAVRAIAALNRVSEKYGVVDAFIETAEDDGGSFLRV